MHSLLNSMVWIDTDDYKLKRAHDDDANCDGLKPEEVERAIDNLSKSGKTFGGLPRRDSMPMMMGRPYDFTGMSAEGDRG